MPEPLPGTSESLQGSTKTAAQQCVIDLVGHVAALTHALQMIEQGYVYRGSERFDIGADEMRVIAREALR